MVILLIIGVVVIIIAFMFFSDVSNTGDQIEAQGGMEKKYKVMIDRFLATPGTRIADSRTKSSIALIGETGLFHHNVIISQINDKVVVKWIVYNTWGKFPKEWSFNEWDDQLDMVYKMSKEMTEYINQISDKHLGGSGTY